MVVWSLVVVVVVCANACVLAKANDVAKVSTMVANFITLNFEWCNLSRVKEQIGSQLANQAVIIVSCLNKGYCWSKEHRIFIRVAFAHQAVDVFKHILSIWLAKVVAI